MTQAESIKQITDGLKGLQAATPQASTAKSGGSDPRTALLGAAISIAELIQQEFAKLPEGAQPAIGDGTFLAMLIQLFEMLLPLIIRFFPT